MVTRWQAARDVARSGRAIGMVLVLVSTVLGMLFGFPGPTLADAADPATAIRGYYVALNKQDLEGTLAWFADNIVFTGADGTVVATNKADWRLHIVQDSFPSHVHVEVTSLQVAGDNVTYSIALRDDGLRDQGMDHLNETLTGVVHNGKIQTLTVTDAYGVLASASTTQQAAPTTTAPATASATQPSATVQATQAAALPQTGAGGAARAGWLAVGGLGGLLLSLGLCSLALARRRA